ncbi:leucine-rich repeat domain-containing protein [Treponema lecithinolyticum]
MSKTSCKKTNIFFYSAVVMLVALFLCIGCKNVADESDFSFLNSAAGKSLYAQVPFGQNGAGLDAYLKRASTEQVNRIELTGLTQEDLKAKKDKTSKLAKILQENPDKKIDLKFDGVIENLTEMCYSFAGCTNLVSAPEIPKTVTKMDGCFKGCTSLAKAPVIPDSVTDLDYCFEGCSALTDMPVIPHSVTDLTGCFKNCTALTKVSKIPDSINVMSSAFEGCTALQQGPEIPFSSEMNIATCFKGCSELRSVTLNCNYISESNFGKAFENCLNLDDGGIQVPAEQLPMYIARASVMGTTPDKFKSKSGS